MIRSNAVAIAAIVFALVIAIAMPTARAADCRQWNTSAFFADATAVHIRDCIASGANPRALDALGESPLHLAVFSKDPNTISTLLEFGANVRERNSLGETPLHKAAVNNHDPAFIEALLSAGADANAQDKTGATALHLAADFNTNPAVIAALIRAGARIDAKDNSGLLPWDYAVRRDDIRNTMIISLLTP